MKLYFKTFTKGMNKYILPFIIFIAFLFGYIAYKGIMVNKLEQDFINKIKNDTTFYGK